jgi:Mg2+/citrate symporter
MLKKSKAVLIICVYFASLFSVAEKAAIVCGSNIDHYTNVYGFEFLLIGWWGILLGTIGWYANVFLFYGLISFLLNEIFSSRICSFVGFLIALSSLNFEKSSFFEVVSDACHGDSKLSSWGIGFYLWLSCFVLLFIFSMVDYKQSRK